MIPRTDLTVEYVRENFLYDASTGILKSKKDEMPFIMSKGYLGYRINNKNYLCHRLIWLFVYGKWPVMLIDHINGNRTDNCIVNLREVDYRLNAHNRVEHREQNKIPCCWYIEGINKYRVKIKAQDKCRDFGYFNTIEEAIYQRDLVLSLIERGESVEYLSRRYHKKAGTLRGAYLQKNKKWRAMLRRKGVLYDLGIYETEKEAHESYCKAKEAMDDPL